MYCQHDHALDHAQRVVWVMPAYPAMELPLFSLMGSGGSGNNRAQHGTRQRQTDSAGNRGWTDAER